MSDQMKHALKEALLGVAAICEHLGARVGEQANGHELEGTYERALHYRTLLCEHQENKALGAVGVFDWNVQTFDPRSDLRPVDRVMLENQLCLLIAERDRFKTSDRKWQVWNDRVNETTALLTEQPEQDEAGEQDKTTRRDGCDKCDGPSGPKTYANQVLMPVNGKVVCVDHCIHHIVAALNAGGVGTIGSCCGHGDPELSSILLEDGRVIRVEAGPITTEPAAPEPVEPAAPQPECDARIAELERQCDEADRERIAAEEKLARLEGFGNTYRQAHSASVAQRRETGEDTDETKADEIAARALLFAYLDKLAAERPTPDTEREEQR